MGRPSRRTAWIHRPKGRNYQVRWIEDGRERRKSVGSRDEAAALALRDEVEAKRRLGLDPWPQVGFVNKHGCEWQAFVDAVLDHQAATGRRSVTHTASRLRIVGLVLQPRYVQDVATPDAITRLQHGLADGKGGRGKPRSPHTVKHYTATLLAALRFAKRQGWIDDVPDVEPVRTSKLRAMKGRPVMPDEFDRMLAAVPDVVGLESAPSWRYLMRGLWLSGLRLGEAMNLHWSDWSRIVPVVNQGTISFLRIPHAMQKSATEDALAVTPPFADLLLETPADDRTGWVFNPGRLQHHIQREPARLSAQWCGKVISRVGKSAGVFVRPNDGLHDAKPASAHDLRRGFATAMASAGIPRERLQRLMRHASHTTTERYYVEAQAMDDAAYLADVFRYSYQVQSGAEST